MNNATILRELNHPGRIIIKTPSCAFCGREFDPGAGSEYCVHCRGERIAAAAASFRETPSRDIDDSILDFATYSPTGAVDGDTEREPTKQEREAQAWRDSGGASKPVCKAQGDGGACKCGNSSGGEGLNEQAGKFRESFIDRAPVAGDRIIGPGIVGVGVVREVLTLDELLTKCQDSDVARDFHRKRSPNGMVVVDHHGEKLDYRTTIPLDMGNDHLYEFVPVEEQGC